MKSIRARLLKAFLIIIAILSFITLAFFLVNLQVVRQYKSISDTMIAEYEIVDSTSSLIDAFNVRMQSAGTNSIESKNTIEMLEASIRERFTYLDGVIEDTVSKSNYLGFKASIEKLTSEINESLKRFEAGSIKDYFTDYNEANKVYEFVRVNGTALIFSQLNYASSLRADIDRTSLIIAAIGIAIIFSIIIACILFAFRFSKKMITPLIDLDHMAQKIAAGDTNVRIGEKLLDQKDEIGSLSRSYNTMLARLFENIGKLDASNKEIVQSSKVLEEKNSELSRINRLMVDRELKMIELKEEIEKLKKKQSDT